MGCVGCMLLQRPRLTGRKWNKCGLPLLAVLSAWRNGGASCIKASVGATVAPGTLGVCSGGVQTVLIFCLRTDALAPVVFGWGRGWISLYRQVNS